MLNLISAFVDIMLHRRGPDDLPASQFLLLLVLAVSLGVTGVIVLVLGGGERAVGWVVLSTLFDVWFVWGVLRTFGKQPRFRQTMTAVLGVGVLLTVISGAVAPLLGSINASTPQLAAVLWVALYLWSVDIFAFVLSRAVERPYPLCFVIVLAYVVLMLTLEATLLQPQVA